MPEQVALPEFNINQIVSLIFKPHRITRAEQQILILSKSDPGHDC